MPGKSTRMQVTQLRFLVLCGLLAVGGCAAPGDDRSQFGAHHQPQTQVVQIRHTVLFPEGNGRLDAEERERLDDFVAQTDPGDGDSVLVAAGQGDPRIVERRRQSVAAYLEMRDVDARVVSSEAISQPPVGEAVDVIVNRYVITLPGCPDWTGTPRLGWTNTPSSNLGCANAVNFGMMLANPRDLAVGRDPGPMDGEASVLGVQRYRDGETKPLNPIAVTIKQSGSSSGGDD